MPQSAKKKTTKKSAAPAKKAAKKTVSKSAKERDTFVAKLKKAGMMADINKKVNLISTGSWVVNRLIGDGSGQDKPGGVPRGFVTEIYGDESAGKTTLALHMVKQALDAGETVLYADFEQTLRIQAKYIESLGIDVNNENFFPIVPDNLQDGIQAIGEGVIALKPALIVIDSVAAMLPKAAAEGDADQGIPIGLHARLVGQFMNFITKRLQKYDTALVLINQLRSNIKQSQYDPGPAQITTGGNALKYFCTLKIRLKKTSKKEKVSHVNQVTGVSEDKMISQEVKVIVEKNKVDIPFKSGPVYIVFGSGIDNVMSLISLAINKKVIKKSGAFLSWNDPGDKYSFNIQGKQKLRQHLIENPEVLEALQPYLIPKQDQEELLSMQKELESKGIENLSVDEKEQLEEIKRTRGESTDSVSDKDLSEDQMDDLAELSELTDLSKLGEGDG